MFSEVDEIFSGYFCYVNVVFTERIGSLQTTYKGVHFTTDRLLYSELLMTDFSVCLREFDFVTILKIRCFRYV